MASLGRAMRAVMLLAVAALFARPSEALVRDNLRRMARWFTGHKCAWRASPVADLTRRLNESVAGQQSAVQEVIQALDTWVSAGGLTAKHTSGPLVLVLVGPTGTGKTATARLVSEALFDDTVTPDGGGGPIPEGSLELHGESYCSAVTRDGRTACEPAPAAASRMLDAIVGRVRGCQGRAAIIFDEFSKAGSDVVRALRPALVGSHDVHDSAGLRASTRGAVFVLTADLLEADLHALVANAAADAAAAAGSGGFEVEVDGETRTRATGVGEAAEAAVVRAMGNRLRQHLQDAWPTLELGSLAAAVVPFVPFTEEAMEKVVALHLRAIERRVADDPRAFGFASLRFDASVVPLFASDEHVEYTVHDPGQRRPVVRFATEGARPLSRHSFPANRAVQEAKAFVARRNGGGDLPPLHPSSIRILVTAADAGDPTRVKVVVETRPPTAGPLSDKWDAAAFEVSL